MSDTWRQINSTVQRLIRTTPVDVPGLDGTPPVHAPFGRVLALHASLSGGDVATLTIRDLDDELRDRLRQRAAANGRSMEAETREILRSVLTRTPSARLGTAIAERFAGLDADEIPIPDRDDRPRPAALG